LVGSAAAAPDTGAKVIISSARRTVFLFIVFSPSVAVALSQSRENCQILVYNTDIGQA
jgi:hypothetical protein